MISKKRKIRILQLVNGFSIGGAERKLLELIKFIDRDRFDITICSVGIDGPLRKDFEDTGYDVFLYTKKNKYDISQVFKVARLMTNRKIDIVMTTLFYADIIGTLAALITRVPYLISWEVRSHPAGSKESKFKHRIFYRFCMKYVNKIVAVSNGVKKFLIDKRSIPASKIKTIHYGIDLAKYYPDEREFKRHELGFKANDRIIGVVARLTVQKGHTYLIDAAPKILKKFPTAKFLFVGDGPLRSDLEIKIKKLGLWSSFYFLGFRNDIVEIINTFDIFVLPSLFEGLPNVILEAMACARPIVATEVDGTPEAIINGDSGILVPPRNTQALVESTIKLLSNTALAKKMGSQARARVEKYFLNENQFMKFQEMYESFFNQ